MNYATALVQIPLVRESAVDYVLTPQNVYDTCIDLATLAQECFTVLSLSTKNRLINRHMITLGTVDCALVHPREVFRPIINDGATACVLVHNHPSGDPAPSAEDLRITRQLVEAGKILDIKIMDHVSVGRKSAPDSPAWLSLRESGLVVFA